MYTIMHHPDLLYVYTVDFLNQFFCKFINIIKNIFEHKKLKKICKV